MAQRTTSLKVSRTLSRAAMQRARVREIAIDDARVMSLRRKLSSRIERVRVAAAKQLAPAVATRPALLRDVLRMPRAANGEAQFSLLCALSESVAHVPRHRRTELLAIVVEFLSRTRDDPALAGRMAADLLADHTLPQDGLGALCLVVRTSRFVTGRALAVGGLSFFALWHADPWKRRATTQLRSTAARDASARVRAVARMGLDRLNRPASRGHSAH